MKPRSNKRAVYHNYVQIGWVARFGENDFRCSSAEGEPTFTTRQQAKDWLIKQNEEQEANAK